MLLCGCPFLLYGQGSWHNDKQEGRGTMLYRDGAVYKGQWAKAMRNGSGTCTYANRDVYTGKWMADKRSGRGAHPLLQGCCPTRRCRTGAVQTPSCGAASHVFACVLGCDAGRHVHVQCRAPVRGRLG